MKKPGKPRKPKYPRVLLVIPVGGMYARLLDRPPPREIVLSYLDDFDRANNLKRGTIYEFRGIPPKGN